MCYSFVGIGGIVSVNKFFNSSIVSAFSQLLIPDFQTRLSGKNCPEAAI